MKGRSHLPQKERDARSQCAKVLHEQDLIAGSMVTMKHTCGKKGCRCARGEKHHSLYLSLSVEGKRKMVSIPADIAPQVEAAVEAYKKIKPRLQTISAQCYKRLVLKHKS